MLGTLRADCLGVFGTTLGNAYGSVVDATLGTGGWIGGTGSSTLGASCGMILRLFAEEMLGPF